ncbi:hypothetical protein [Mucilaginibacter aquaedulcis]|uniref:hypothetical protein n=1 Tax=Mucilaginibacter aquaedulcis TaxID=1187081 RepID=UPI0025B59E56|nr:hypothetical protein [Mucilaginibacter aquaedulcis]MDN3548781.1 hypothetical protein [Mucilaginibacter aquaedulcis]
MKKLKLSFDNFEVLSEDAEGKLVSGFSDAFFGDALMQFGGGSGNTSNDKCTNNCAGGNCISGCGN